VGIRLLKISSSARWRFCSYQIKLTQNSRKWPDIWQKRLQSPIMRLECDLQLELHSYVSLCRCRYAFSRITLHDLIQFHAPTRQLRSNGRSLLHVDRVKSVFAERAFCHSAPAIWNSLPPHLTTDLSTLSTFKRHLKTEPYRRAFLR
jgi:hypothetical protein